MSVCFFTISYIFCDFFNTSVEKYSTQLQFKVVRLKLVFQQQQLLASTQKIQVYISCKQGVIWTVMWLINQLTITCFAEDETKNLIGKKIRNDDILGNFSKHGFLFRWRLESFLTTQSWILSSCLSGQVEISRQTFPISAQNSQKKIIFVIILCGFLTCKCYVFKKFSYLMQISTYERCNNFLFVEENLTKWPLLHAAKRASLSVDWRVFSRGFLVIFH